MLQFAAIRLQNVWRGHKGRGDVKVMISIIEAKKRQAALELASAQKIQKVVRGHWGRQRAQERQEYLDQKALELHSTEVSFFAHAFQ